MNILMITNTYLPHVGGVARSVSLFRDEFRRRGHRVVVIAPQYDGPSDDETDVIRVPSIRHFNGTEFSLELPVPGLLHAALAGFRPDVVHSHHPFLLGDSALRLARLKGVPLVYTFHTMWEHYAHYVREHSPWLKRFVSSLAVGYAGLTDRVFAPSASVADFLRRSGVRAPVAVVPTGIDLRLWRSGDGCRFRRSARIPPRAPVAGYLGRLAAEKNLEFLAESVIHFLRRERGGVFLVVGDGPHREPFHRLLKAGGMERRIRWAGILSDGALADAVHAMDVLVFSSKSETQGLVLAEAMGAGVPVVALDAPGSRDIVRDGANGRLVPAEDPVLFAEAIRWALLRTGSLRASCLKTARRYAMGSIASRALRLYGALIKDGGAGTRASGTLAELRADWSLIQNLAAAATRAGHEPEELRAGAPS